MTSRTENTAPALVRTRLRTPCVNVAAFPRPDESSLLGRRCRRVSHTKRILRDSRAAKATVDLS